MTLAVCDSKAGKQQQYLPRAKQDARNQWMWTSFAIVGYSSAAWISSIEWAGMDIAENVVVDDPICRLKYYWSDLSWKRWDINIKYIADCPFASLIGMSIHLGISILFSGVGAGSTPACDAHIGGLNNHAYPQQQQNTCRFLGCQNNHNKDDDSYWSSIKLVEYIIYCISVFLMKNLSKDLQQNRLECHKGSSLQNANRISPRISE